MYDLKSERDSGWIETKFKSMYCDLVVCEEEDNGVLGRLPYFVERYCL